ncbi:hypothetical protein [Ferruginibacter sp. SUN106]|uniref:hypothetical protein n=1 Tax=Ferruginibacter sp. SUN106 TaxID=2978348 RepID=UPI003D36C81F
MKKIAGLVVIMFCSFAVTAQTDLKKKIVDSTCACLSELPDISKKSQEELQMAIGQCMMKKSLEDFMALAQERNIEMTDAEAMQKLGAEIGMDLMKADCKAMTEIMMKMAQTQMKSPSPEKSEVVRDTRMVSGKVTNVEVKDFIYITVLSGAKSTQLVWSDYVTNGNNYAKNLLSLKNKSVEFSYIEKEVYSTKAKAYVSVKMIAGIE